MYTSDSQTSPVNATEIEGGTIFSTVSISKVFLLKMFDSFID